MKYIVVFDYTDPVMQNATDALHQMYPEAPIVEFNQVEAWPNAAPGDMLYLINHGNGQTFGDYNNPLELVHENPNLNQPINNVDSIVLVSCSTAQQAGLIFPGGFQAQTFAQNLSDVYPQKEIVAAVGPVYTDGMGNLVVNTPTGAEGIVSENGWVAFQDGVHGNIKDFPFEQ